MTIDLHNLNNLLFKTDKKFDVIYADFIYEDLDFTWVYHFWNMLKDGGVMIQQTDYHSVAEIKIFTQRMRDANFLNWLTWKNEFGNFRKDRFRQCHDDILIFSKGKNCVWHPEKIQVPKATAGSKGLNKSGRETKLATSVITDICLTTVAKERVKKEDGHNIRWQKPLALYSRILEPFLDSEHNEVLDAFMGSGSLGRWCKMNNYNYTGIEYDTEVFKYAEKNIYGYQ